MSDEIAQDEEDAEDYDLEAIQSRSERRQEDDDDDATLVGGRRGPNGSQRLPDEDVVFEIGDDDEDDEEAGKKNRKPDSRLSGDNDDYRPVGRSDEERQDLMGRRAD